MIEKYLRVKIFYKEYETYLKSLAQNEALLEALLNLPDDMIVQSSIQQGQFGPTQIEKRVAQRREEVKNDIVVLTERMKSAKSRFLALFVSAEGA